MAHKFLSESWFDAVDEITKDVEVPAEAQDVIINVLVKGAPDGDVQMTVKGGLFSRGVTEGAPTSITVPYEVARDLLIKRDPSAAMQAFMAGQIQLQGDMTKLMALQTTAVSPAQVAVAEKLLAITEV